MTRQQLSKKTPSMSSLLASKGVQELGQSLNLTQQQLTKATSEAMRLSTDPKLANTDHYSLIKYCFETARFNFVRDDAIYPVPYYNRNTGTTQVQAQMGYKGFVELAMRSGKYREISASPVYSCDYVKRDRLTGNVIVEFEEDYNKTKGAKKIGFYAYAIDKQGNLTNSLFWDIDKLEKHGKRYSKTYNSLWGANEYTFDKMASKTVIKQLVNELDMSPELQQSITLDQLVFGGKGEQNTYLDNPFTSNDIEAELTDSGIDIATPKVIDINDYEETPNVEDNVEEKPKKKTSKKTKAKKAVEEEDENYYQPTLSEPDTIDNIDLSALEPIDDDDIPF